VLCQGHEGSKTVSDLFGLTMPLIPVRGYSLDILPKNYGDKLPLIEGVLRWNIDGDAYFLCAVKENSWRIVSYLDIAPGRNDFFDDSRITQLKSAFNRTIGKGLSFDYTFESPKSRCRPVTPDDIPIVGNLSSAKNVYIHNGMGGFGSVSLGTAKVLADVIADDIFGTDSSAREKFNYLSP